MAVLNGDSNDFFAQFNKTSGINHVILAYDLKAAVGCGAIKEYQPGIMEIKRMFVQPHKRGNGIGQKILNELLIWAKELNYDKCVLETGNKMPEAINLYKKCNFKIIPNYGQYAGITASICFGIDI